MSSQISSFRLDVVFTIFHYWGTRPVIKIERTPAAYPGGRASLDFFFLWFWFAIGTSGYWDQRKAYKEL